MITQLNKMALSLVVGVIFLGSSSHADHFLTMSSGGVVSDAFVADVGDTLTVDFFLTETSPDSILANEGIIGFGLDLDHTAGLGAISSADPDGFFNVNNHDERSSTGFEWEYFEEAGTGLKGSSVLLGSMDFLVTGEGTTTFTLSDRLVGSAFNDASWFTPSGSSIDTSIFGSDGTGTFSFTVSTRAIPEPGSMIFLPAMACLVFRRKRKRLV